MRTLRPELPSQRQSENLRGLVSGLRGNPPNQGEKSLMGWREGSQGSRSGAVKCQENSNGLGCFSWMPGEGAVLPVR